MTHARIRLPGEAYTLPNPVSVTLCTRHRRPVFCSSALAHACIASLRAMASRHGIPVYAYCFMPDHVPLLLAPSENMDVIRVIGR